MWTGNGGPINGMLSDALNWSQRKEVEDLTDDPVATEVAIEEQVSAHHGFSVELMEEDLQKWTTAYKEDRGHVTVYTKLR